ncbi:MAG: phosphate starvation-inducible protein PhoH [Ignavibacteria bacterium GWA2_55_25]|nr:MAG: phosphate starvation-inducible protein PhoH [Ignavibacteria bacterium GWA2_55_25]
MVERKLQLAGVDVVQLLGFNDANLQMIEERFDATITVRGDQIMLRGSPVETAKIEKIFKELIYILNKNGNLTPNDVDTVIDLVTVNGSSPEVPKEIPGDDSDYSILYTRIGVIKARTAGQKGYIQQVKKNDIVFAIGPAGTGKTYLAVALAVAALKNRDVTKIMLARPAVEAGESLGFLPGDLREKVDPYLRPLYDALDDMLSAEKLKSYMEKRIIEIVPLAYMRGRTLHNAFVILDEAQNATAMQMKMFLTRLGAHSRAIITGDITQIDLPQKTVSGLVQIQEVLKSVQGVSFAYLDASDVVRHRLVKDIINAYERFQNGNSGEPKRPEENTP